MSVKDSFWIKLKDSSNIRVSWKEAGALILCCSINILIFAAVLSKQSLWCDELVQLITVRRSFADGMLQLQDYAAPLYQLLLRLLVHEDFPNEWLIRFPAFICAILSLVAIWWLARLLMGKRVAVLTLAIVTLNPFFIYYSGEGRPYSMFLLFSVLSMGSFYHLVSKGRLSTLIFYVISTVFLIYSHYLGFLLLLSQAAYALAEIIIMRRGSQQTVRITLAFGIISVLAAPSIWLFSRYLLSGSPAIVAMIGRPRVTDLLWLRQAGILLGDPILCVLWLGSTVLAFWFWPLSSNARPDLKKTFNQDPRHWLINRAPIFLCLFWVLSSLYLPLVISYFVRPVYIDRYGFPVLVPLAIVIATVVSRFNTKTQVVVMLVILTLPFYETFDWLKNPRTDYPKLVEKLRELNDDQNPIFVADWPYCENFINPESYGLRYYGYEKTKITLLLLNYPRHVAIRYPGQLPSDQHLFVVSFVGWKAIEKYLKDQPRAFRMFKFGELHLFEIEKEMTKARWLSSDK